MFTASHISLDVLLVVYGGQLCQLVVAYLSDGLEILYLFTKEILEKMRERKQLKTLGLRIFLA